MGDFFDVVKTEEGLAIVLADASGKGIPAALLASTLQGMIYGQLISRVPLVGHSFNSGPFDGRRKRPTIPKSEPKNLTSKDLVLLKAIRQLESIDDRDLSDYGAKYLLRATQQIERISQEYLCSECV